MGVLQTPYLSSILSISKIKLAQVTQLVEWNIEAIFVVSSNLTLGKCDFGIMVIHMTFNHNDIGSNPVSRILFL